MFQNRLYVNSPIRLQEAMISARTFFRNAVRMGIKFRRTVNEIKKNEFMSPDEIETFQVSKIKDLLQYCEKDIPYYRRLFRIEGITSSDIKNLSDFKKIPILNKREIRENGQDLIYRGIALLKTKGSTSGTSGSPITIHQNLNAVIREQAFVWRQLQWAGHKQGDKSVWLRGDVIAPISQKVPPFWRFNRVDNMLMMSSYHLSEASAPKYIEALESFNPKLIQAYPSSIGFLAQYLENRNQEYRGTNLKAIVTSSETLTDYHREIISQRMGCRIFDWYGGFERVILILTCEEGNYHLNSDYGLMELKSIDPETTEMIGTGFNNRHMPFIRYDTHDIVEMEDNSFECPCGRKFPVVKKIIGRIDDYIQVKNGRFIGRLDHIFKGLSNIGEAQILQDDLDEIKVMVVPLSGYNEEERGKLIKNAKQRLGEDMKIHVEEVSNIPRTKRGKFKAVVRNF